MNAQPSLMSCENKTAVGDYAFAHALAETRRGERNRLPKLRELKQSER